MKQQKTKEAEVIPKSLSKKIPTSFWIKLFVVAQLCFLAWQFTPDLSTNGDDARYYLLGKALHDGKGFHQIQHPTLPVETTYPIVFPMMLAFVHIFSGSILLAKIMLSILGALVTVLVFYLFRSYTATLLLPVIALCAGCATLTQFSSSLMSEIPYLFVSLLSLILYERSVANKKNIWLFWIAIVISILPMHCRSVGLAFSASWFVTNIFTKRYRYALAHAVVLVGSVAIFHYFTSWQNSYLIQIIQRNTYNPDAGFVTPAEMVQRIIENIRAYSTNILERSIAPLAVQPGSSMELVIALPCLVLILAGWVRSLFGPMRFLSIYVFMYFGILLMWQTQWSSERFVAGVIPFLYFFLLYGVQGFFLFAAKSAESLKARFVSFANTADIADFGQRFTVWTITAILLIINISFQTTALKRTQEQGPDWKNFYACADWIRTNTPKDAIVMNRKVELFYIRSERTGVMYPYSHDVNAVYKVIDTSHVDYVIFDNFAWTATTRQYLYPVIEAFPNHFQMIYALNNPPTAIYKVIR